VQRVKRAMAVLPDNAIAGIAVDYARASEGGIEIMTVDGVPIPVGRKELLIETKQTVRPSDAADVQFLRLRIAADRDSSST